MNGSEAAEYQRDMNIREHMKAEWEQESLLDEGIYSSVHNICGCSVCRGLREAEARSR